MSRTLNDLPLGTHVWLNENGAYEEYWLIKKTATTAWLLRQYCITGKRMHSSNTGVYAGSELDTWLENDSTGFLSRFDSDTLGAIVSETISYVYWDTSTSSWSSLGSLSRRAFCLSEDEVGSNNSRESDENLLASFILAQGNAYGESNVRICKNAASGTAQYWWLRSPGSSTQFRVVLNNGSMNNGNATNKSSVRPCLAVAIATSVSDEGASTIYLLPETAPEYLEVEAVWNLGENSNRPAKARVLVDTYNLYDVDVKLSINAGDTTPIWESTPNGTETEITNTTKTTTNWQIAVKLYGKCADRDGYFGAPSVLILEE